MRWWGCAVVCITLINLMPAAAAAETTRRPPTSILVDALTGEVLNEEDAGAPRPLGALSQLMVLLLSLEEAGFGALRLDVPVTVSADAVKLPSSPITEGGTLIPLRANKVYLLSDLLKAVLIGSADDAAVAAAEAIAGSIPASLDLMNARAQRLGMAATHFSSVGGEPCAELTEPDSTTARDQAKLARALLRYPMVVQWASLSGLPFDQGSTLLRNVNQLTGTVPGVDGLQVANSPVTGYSIVATAQRDALRLIAVVLDAKDSATRYRMAAELLESGFARYERLEILTQGESLNMPIRVVKGSVARLTPILGQTVSLLHRRNEERDLQIHYQLPAVLTAPVKRDQPIGEVIVQENGQLVAVVPVLSPANVTHVGILSAAIH